MTLEDDVARRLEEEMKRTGRSWKQVINDYLRAGLTASRRKPASKPFRVKPRPMRLRQGLSVDNVAELLEQVEGSGHR